MFINFFLELRQAKLPVSLREYLTLMEAMEKGVANHSLDDFYYLSRSCLVKDEKHLDRFDRVFGTVFKGLERPLVEEGALEEIDIPDEWLQALAEKLLTEEEKAEIEALGGWEELMQTLRDRLAEQEGRHEGGSKWIGTAGTSPFGAYGYNPEGVRIGQHRNRNNRAVKVWDKREFKNLDGSVELGTRNIKVALRRLRRFARSGAQTELDLGATISATAKQGFLDVKLRAERHNAVKVLLFLDVGGSMDPYIRICEELFSAARSEFKHLEFYYFHNFTYEGMWKDNRRRWDEQVSTLDILHTYASDYRVVFVGDASMSPYEIVYPGGAVEHWNEEAGTVWFQRILDTYPNLVWLNPERQGLWDYTQSNRLIRQMLGDRMYPLTLDGLDRAMRGLTG